MDKDIAIKVEGVSKTFKIPHEKISSLRGAFMSGLSGFFSKPSFETGKSSALGNSEKLSFKDGKKLSFRIKANQLTGFSDFVIIQTPETTRPDHFGMAGFVL